MKIIKNKKIIFILLLSQIVLCNNSYKSAYCINAGEILNRYNIPEPQELNKSIDQLLESIIRIDINSITKYLDDDVEMWQEVYEKKGKIINELQQKKDLYNYLFNTIKYRELESKLSREPVSILCIRDQLLLAQKNKLRIDHCQNIFRNNENTTLEVIITWDGQLIKEYTFRKIRFVYWNKKKMWQMSSFVFWY